MPERSLTILFMPESAYGPTNNCIGIGDVLRRRGHRVVFAAEASWKGRLETLGFTEDLVDLAAPASDAAGAEAADEDAGQFWKDFIRDTAPEFRKPTIEQLETWIRPVWEELIAGARYCQDRLAAIVHRTRPDVVVEDNVVCFPALMTAGAPFVRIVSCNPLEIKGPDVPPTFSGYPSADRTGWHEFRDEYERVHRAMGGLQRVGDRAGCATLARSGVHPRGRGESVRLSGDGRLHRRPAARALVAPAGLVGAGNRRAVRCAGTACP